MMHTNSALFRIADTTTILCGESHAAAAALNQATDTWVARLLTAGVTMGDRVAVFGGKSIAQSTLMLAILRMGAVLVPIYSGLKAAQVDHIIADSLPVLAIVPDASLDLFRPACTARGVGLLTMDALAQGQGGLQGPMPPAGQPDADDPAAIIYTSGSTGLPKGVVFSRRNLILGARSVAGYVGMTRNDRVLCLLPFSFDAGLNQFLAAIVAGSSIVLADFIHAAPLAALCKKTAVTIITAVPGLWTKIGEHDWKDCGASVRMICNTGGHFHPELMERVRAIFSRAAVMPMYGFTEAFRCARQTPQGAVHKPGSVGRAIPHASFAIISDAGRLCQAGEVGELVQFGPLVTLGYWKLPEVNREKFRPIDPGILAALQSGGGDLFRCDPAHLGQVARSGDLMRVDGDGDLYFVNRKDAMIKANGFRISPTELENACMAEGALAAVAIHHATDRGDVIAVIWLAGPEDTEPAASKIARLKQKLPGYMVPQVIEKVTEMPVSANGKFDRNAIKAAFVNRKEFVS